MAAPEAKDNRLNLQTLLNEFYFPHTNDLVTDSKITFELSASTQEPAESLSKVA